MDRGRRDREGTRPFGERSDPAGEAQKAEAVAGVAQDRPRGQHETDDHSDNETCVAHHGHAHALADDRPRPRKCATMTMTATTRRMWIKAPDAGRAITPKTHSARITAAIMSSMLEYLPFGDLDRPSTTLARPRSF